jgi:hypothetical protein
VRDLRLLDILDLVIYIELLVASYW